LPRLRSPQRKDPPEVELEPEVGELRLQLPSVTATGLATARARRTVLASALLPETETRQERLHVQ
jgi:hypothetical protein